MGGKRKAAAEPVPGARARMQKMIQAAAVRAKPKAMVDDASTDALLDDILGGLGPERCARPAGGGGAPRLWLATCQPSFQVRRVQAASAPCSWLHVVYAILCRPACPVPGLRISKLAAAASPAARVTTAFRPTAPTPSLPARRVAGLPPAPAPDGAAAQLSAAPAGMAAAAATAAAAASPGPLYDDDSYPAEESMIVEPPLELVSAPPAPTNAGQPAAAVPASAPAAAAGLGSPANNGSPGAGVAAAGSKTPWRTPAPITAEVKTPTPATAAPASGWQAIYQDHSDPAMPAGQAAGEPAAPAAVPDSAGVADAGDLPLDEEGQLPFYLLDACEEPAQPGVVYLFGKVRWHGL